MDVLCCVTSRGWRAISRGWRVVIFTALISTMNLLTGCGTPQAPVGKVEGRVTFNGQDVDGGRIRFTPPGSGSPVEGDIKGGRYSVAQVPVGNTKVSIYWVKSTGKKQQIEGPGSGDEILEEFIPAKYNDNTELTHNVTEGTSSKDFDLKGKR